MKPDIYNPYDARTEAQKLFYLQQQQNQLMQLSHLGGQQVNGICRPMQQYPVEEQVNQSNINEQVLLIIEEE